MLRIDSLTFHYPQRQLFSGLSAQIPSGITLVKGDESTGKTTLLRLLAGELKPHSGRIDGPSPVFWTDPKSTAFDQVTVARYFESLRARYPMLDAGALDRLVDVLSLKDHHHKPLYMLSAGSKRKVWLAAAFASGAPVTLMDEPFAALDMASINVVTQLLAETASTSAEGPAPRTFVVAAYQSPPGVPLAATINLDS